MMRMKLLLLSLVLSAQSIISYGQKITIDQNRIQIPVLKFKSATPVLQFKINTSKEQNVKSMYAIIQQYYRKYGSAVKRWKYHAKYAR